MQMLWEAFFFLRSMVAQSMSTVFLYMWYENLSKKPLLNLKAKQRAAELQDKLGQEYEKMNRHEQASFREQYIEMLDPLCSASAMQMFVPSANLFLLSKLFGFEYGTFLVLLAANSLLQVYIIDDYLLYLIRINSKMNLILIFFYLMVVFNWIMLSLFT